MNSSFHPHQQLAHQLLPFAGITASDGSHDLSQLSQVWKNAAAVSAEEGGDTEVLLAAMLSHADQHPERFGREGARVI